MPRTPDRRPGPQLEDDRVQFNDRGSDPSEVGSVWNNGDQLFARDSTGVFNLRQGGGGSDENVKVSNNDTTAAKLTDKLVATEGIQLAELNDGADEDLQAKLDINGLTADATPDGAADYIATYDASAGAHKKVLIDNLPTGGGSGGAKREVIACNDLDNAHIRSPHSTYTCVTRFTFGGTTAVGTPAAVKGVGFHTDGGGTAQFRIYDLTNAQQIAESAAFSNTDPQIFSFGALSNLSTGEAIWEIQGKASTKNAFISSVEIHW